MPKRIKDYSTTATSYASDDYLAMDGATNGTRKILAYTVGVYPWSMNSSGVLSSTTVNTPLIQLKPALTTTECGLEWLDSTSTRAGYVKYTTNSADLLIDSGKSGGSGKIVFYTNETDCGRFTSARNFTIGVASSETGLTGAGGCIVGSTTLGTSTTTGALVVGGTIAGNKKAFIKDGLRLEQTATTIYSDFIPLSTGHTDIYGTTASSNFVGRITSTAVNNTSVNSRFIQSGIAFDSFTSGRKVTHSTPAIGTVDCSIELFFIYPSTSNPSSDDGLLYAGPDSLTNSAATVGFTFKLDSSGRLQAGVQSTGGYSYLLFSSFISTYGTKMVHVVLTRTGTTVNVYFNGVLQSGTPSTSGSIPWDSSINSLYVIANGGLGGWPGQSQLYGYRIWNRVLTQTEIVTAMNTGVPVADKSANLTGQTSGTLTRGKRYRITTYVAGDSFTNVGAGSNATGVEFVATGTTPTTWTNSSTLNQIGCLLDADCSVGVGYQIPDKSSNNYHGVMTSTGVVHTVPQRRGQLRVTSNTSGNQQLLGSQVCLPTNAIITSIIGYTTGTPTIKIGNVSAGSQIVASVAMSASTYQSFTVAATTTTTGNLWVNSTTSDTINWTITYMIADP